jgi:hypothetical protein
MMSVAARHLGLVKLSNKKKNHDDECDLLSWFQNLQHKKDKDNELHWLSWSSSLQHKK